MSRIIYQPTWDSLDQHKLPKWFMDSKLGIFIHWGPYCVPAWAPKYAVGKGQYYDEDIGYHPYAELYGWGMTYKDSPVWKHHLETYGPGFQYEDFFPMFKAENFDADKWASLFEKVGAKYVVLVTKHSDGFCMFNTAHSKRSCMHTGPMRDVTDEITKAVRNHNMRMGLYYSTTFNYYYDRVGHITYRDLTNKQIHELVEQYDPDILWSDDYWKPSEKSFATTWKSEQLISYFYNHAKDPEQVVVNDRWGVTDNGLQLGDFSTPEYRILPYIPDFYWELTRGIGQSYGYNADDNYHTVEEIIFMLVDVVSKNGNMLLNVGPRSDGTLDPAQIERLEGLGEFLSRCGEAIYSSRHWIDYKGDPDSDALVRYTWKPGSLYAIVMGEKRNHITLRDLRLRDDSRIELLGENQNLSWTQDDNGVHIQLPGNFGEKYAQALKISPEPFKLSTYQGDRFEDRYAEIFRRDGFLKMDL